MRLLDTYTGQFIEKDPRDPDTKYAILSHTWDREGEQTYQELRDIQKRYAPGPKRQSSDDRRHMPGNRPSVGPQQNVAPLTPSQSLLLLTLLLILLSLLPPHDTLQRTPSAKHGESSSASALSLSSAPSSPSDTSQAHSETLLSPIWDDPKLSPKIREACKIARENGYQYIWIDSCCIDKTSSSELSEAINSMYQ
ncbi:hypothetical protein GSI_08834 [Ganoderma sinense ZZ0214-1]|uniref:Heterokaryon incompatibility domain-containing protein n=1 Tax=Ganoderma sinense ZZ0214-1 TaxID=1077348 RepID=A0A2G8S4U0_9APHY|nr:hypothetical protein GSI_08834 [Ganoderma sinense ZZ0214-1]